MTRILAAVFPALLVSCPPGLSEQQATPASAPDPSCALAPEGMLCVSARSGGSVAQEAEDCLESPSVAELPEDLPTFFLDSQELTVAEAHLCVERCACSDHLLELVGDAALQGLAQGFPRASAAHLCQGLGKHLPSQAEWSATVGLRSADGAAVPGQGTQLNAISLLSGIRCAASVTEARLMRLRGSPPPVFLPLDGPSGLRQRVDPEVWSELEAAGPLPETAHALRDEIYRAHVGQPPAQEDGVVLANASYKDVWMVEDALLAWHRLYPDITRVGVIGLSHQGRPVLALRITDNPDQDEDEPAVLINGSAHGHELLSTDHAFEVIERVLGGYGAGAPEQRWVEDLDLWVVPLVNPDGNWATLRVVSHPKKEIGRKNGRDNDGDCSFEPPGEGVDLNRAYPFGWGMLGEDGSKSWSGSPYYRGPGPGSEPEPQAIMRLAHRYHFAASVSFHTWGTMIMSPYTIPGLENPEPDTAWAVAQGIADGMPVQPNGRRFVVKKMMYPVDGTDQDWLYHEHGTLAYILEGSHHNPLDPAMRQASTEGAWPFTEGLIWRLLDGPGVSGHVRDPQGRPVQATVAIPEILHHQEEDWRSRAHDGRFDRFLPSTGEWTLQVWAEGYQPTQATVIVNEGEWKQVELVLEPVAAGR